MDDITSKRYGSAIPNYVTINNIRIYDGTTKFSSTDYDEKIKQLKQTLEGKEKIFTDIKPSTLTAQGKLTNILFLEKKFIETLKSIQETHPIPPEIQMIGCNYGEIFNPTYQKPKPKKTSGRGRKPKPKKKSKRKVQGNGRYFSSQITFVIKMLDSDITYKIKLFRTGVFQVPGVREPSMHDLVMPIGVLRDYLAKVLNKDVQVINFTSVMRNYKSSLVNKHYHVDLQKLEEIIIGEKYNPIHETYIDYMLRDINSSDKTIIKKMIGNFHPLKIAEMTYNTDRCFYLMIKFYRPALHAPSKKTTVKLLKKGKINFDGGNSEKEIMELYYWLQTIYHKYKDQILFDKREIKNEYNEDSSECSADSLYDSDSDYSSPDETEPNINKKDAALKIQPAISYEQMSHKIAQVLNRSPNKHIKNKRIIQKKK